LRPETTLSYQVRLTTQGTILHGLLPHELALRATVMEMSETGPPVGVAMSAATVQQSDEGQARVTLQNVAAEAKLSVVVSDAGHCNGEHAKGAASAVHPVQVQEQQASFTVASALSWHGAANLVFPILRASAPRPALIFGFCYGLFTAILSMFSRSRSAKQVRPPLSYISLTR
jgi:hypothetical protein